MLFFVAMQTSGRIEVEMFIYSSTTQSRTREARKAQNAASQWSRIRYGYIIGLN